VPEKFCPTLILGFAKNDSLGEFQDRKKLCPTLILGFAKNDSLGEFF
jgi:hypothetical protein